MAQNNDLDEIYNMYLASSSAQLLLERPEKILKTDIDRQLVALQMRIKENLDILEETREKIGLVDLVKVQTELSQFQHEIGGTLSDEPAFVTGKNFTELMSEIDKIRNQLPTKQVAIPDTEIDIVELQNATSKLLESLDCLSAEFDQHQVSTASSAAGLQKIKEMRRILENRKNSVGSVVAKASACALNEVVSKVDGSNVLRKPP